jgi:hypothetical protein
LIGILKFSECILSKPGTDVIIFKYIFAKKIAKLLACFAQTTASFGKNLINHGFLRKTPFFRQKWAKIVENCNHNIDP